MSAVDQNLLEVSRLQTRFVDPAIKVSERFAADVRRFDAFAYRDLIQFSLFGQMRFDRTPVDGMARALCPVRAATLEIGYGTGVGIEKILESKTFSAVRKGHRRLFQREVNLDPTYFVGIEADEAAHRSALARFPESHFHLVGPRESDLLAALDSWISGGVRFHFIMSRYFVDLLPDPTPFLRRCAELLVPTPETNFSCGERWGIYAHLSHHPDSTLPGVGHHVWTEDDWSKRLLAAGLHPTVFKTLPMKVIRGGRAIYVSGARVEKETET